MEFNYHYLARYQEFIRRCLIRILPHSDYHEEHHIHPVSLGGNNSTANLIMLTAREHFVAHWLLWKALPKTPAMMSAFYGMSNRNAYKGCIIRSSKVYEKLKIEAARFISELNTGWSVVRTDTGEIIRILSQEYKDRNDLKGLTSGMLSVITLAGEKLWVTVGEYYNNDNLIHPFSGKVCARDKLGNKIWVTKEQYLHNEDLTHIQHGYVIAFSKFNNKCVKVTKEEYSLNDDLIDNRKGTCIVYSRMTGNKIAIEYNNFDPLLHLGNTGHSNKFLIQCRNKLTNSIENVIIFKLHNDQEKYEILDYDHFSKIKIQINELDRKINHDRARKSANLNHHRCIYTIVTPWGIFKSVKDAIINAKNEYKTGNKDVIRGFETLKNYLTNLDNVLPTNPGRGQANIPTKWLGKTPREIGFDYISKYKVE